jgi:hypothetical protein
MDDSNDDHSRAPAARRNVHYYLPDDDPNFSIRDLGCGDSDGDPLNPDAKDKDPNAKKRLTASRNKGRDGLRPVLIRKAYRTFMKRLPPHRRNKTEVVRLIRESWAAKPPHGFGIRISVRTVYRALEEEE